MASPVSVSCLYLLSLSAQELWGSDLGWERAAVLGEVGVRDSAVQACPEGIPPSRGHTQVTLRLVAGLSHALGDVARSEETRGSGYSILQLPSPETACVPRKLEQSMPCLRESQLGKALGNVGKSTSQFRTEESSEAAPCQHFIS